MAHTNLQRFGMPPRSPATAQSQESLPPSNPSFLFRLFLSRRHQIFLFFAPFCLFLTGLSGLLSTPTAAFSNPLIAVLRTYVLAKSQKKQEPPQTIQSVPKAWTCTHSAYMSLLLFLSVLFVGFLMMLCHTYFCMTVKFNPALCVTEIPITRS